MTKTKIEIESKRLNDIHRKLSIQVSLNGLSFCVLDTVDNKLTLNDTISFDAELTPYLLQKELKSVLEKHRLIGKKYDNVTVVHQNKLFSLVPKALFDENELANYLKFNAKLMANDCIEYDEIENQDIVCVYIPYTNINNYLFDLFGEFEFRHSSSIFLQTLLNNKFSHSDQCIVRVEQKHMELLVVSQKKLQLYNQYEFATPDDFLYYLLFSFEQLQLDLETLQLKLFGAIEEGDPIYNNCYKYVRNVAVIAPPHPNYVLVQDQDVIDFTVLNSL